MRLNLLSALAWAVGALLQMGQPADAHTLLLDVRATEDSIYARAAMDDGSPVRRSPALLQSEQGEILAKGVTSDSGTVAFPRPDLPGLTVVVFGVMGHRGEAVLSARPANATHMAPAPTPLRDVIGGLGWIAGIVGFSLYLLERRKRRRRDALPPHA